MADVQIEAAAHATSYFMHVRLGPVWIDDDTAYVFYINSASDLVYRKTADGGANWAAAVGIYEGTVTGASIWFDKWTPGDSGTKIHTAWIESDTDDVHYRSLDTATDTLGTDEIVWAGVSASSGGWGTKCIDITKSRGGNLYCGFWIDQLGEIGFYRSVDNGDNWVARAALADGNAVDGILLFPGDEADTDDIWCIYWDRSADEISLKVYDDSGNSWAETSISLNMAGSDAYYQMSGAQRASDNHVILAAWSELNAATADLKVWDIGGAASITAKTNVLTDTAEAAQCAVFINQQTDDIYIAYLKGTDFTTLVGAHYKKSDDGGGTWGGETALSADAEDDLRAIWAGHSVGDEGGYFMPAWFNDDLDDLMTNTANAVAIAAAGAAPQTLTPAPLAIPLVIPALAIALTLILAPTPAAVALAVPAPTVILTNTLAPDPVTTSLAVPAPTLTHSLTLAPDPVPIPLAIPAPTVFIGGLLLPTPVEVTLAIPSPTLVLTKTLTPDPAVVALAIPAPIVTSALALIPTPVAVPLAIPVPTLGLTLDLQPTPIAVLIAIPSPTIIFGVQTLTPDPVSILFVIPIPAIPKNIISVAGSDDTTIKVTGSDDTLISVAGSDDTKISVQGSV